MYLLLGFVKKLIRFTQFYWNMDLGEYCLEYYRNNIFSSFLTKVPLFVHLENKVQIYIIHLDYLGPVVAPTVLQLEM